MNFLNKSTIVVLSLHSLPFLQNTENKNNLQCQERKPFKTCPQCSECGGSSPGTGFQSHIWVVLVPVTSLMKQLVPWCHMAEPCPSCRSQCRADSSFCVHSRVISSLTYHAVAFPLFFQERVKLISPQISFCALRDNILLGRANCTLWNNFGN